MPQLDSSAFWGIAGIVVGAIIATFFFVIGKKKTLLQYDISTTPLITEKMAGILNDRMSIDGQSVKSLSSTTIKFINSGNRPIKSSDFSKQEPLRIIFKGHLYGHDVSLGNQKLLPKVEPVSEPVNEPVNESINESINESANERVLNISFENLKPRQFFVVTILHDKSLNVSGELTTGDMRKFHSSEPIVLSTGIVLTMIILMIVSILAYDQLSGTHIIDHMSFVGNAIWVAILVLVCVGFIFASVSYLKELYLYPNPRKIAQKKAREELQNLK